MDRNEAVLRELNLYPQWALRAAPVLATVAPQEQVASPAAPASAAEAEHAYAAYVAMEAAREEARLPVEVVEAAAAFRAASNWPELKQQVRACQRCDLRAGCQQTVFGGGDEQADWMFIGEAPGVQEDEHGEPFVGEAGRLLDNMLAAIRLKRGQAVYIANVVKCRPPENRSPDAAEAARCLPYLARQIELVQPKLIVLLGKVVARSVLGEEGALDDLRGVLHDYQGIPVVVTYHPAYLLRRPTAKAQAWQDLCFAVDVMQQA